MERLSLNPNRRGEQPFMFVSLSIRSTLLGRRPANRPNSTEKRTCISTPRNERQNVPHRFFRQCLFPARGYTFLVHIRIEHRRRPFWLTRTKAVPNESPYPLRLVPTR